MEVVAGPLEVLVIEDDADHATLIRRLLERRGGGRFALDVAGSLGDALARLARGRVDAALLDLTLPDSRGLATVTALRARAAELPIVVLTATRDEALAVETMQQGADDYLVKGSLDGDALARALLHAIERRRAVQRLAHSEAQLQEAQAIAHVGSFEWQGGERARLSAELCRIWGLPVPAPGEEVPLAPLRDRIVEEDRDAWRRASEAMITRGEAINLRARVRRGPDDVRHVVVLGRGERDAAGAIVRAVGTVQDVSELHAYEEQLLLAGRMAAVGTLASGVAHEINNPLSYVLGSLELAARELARAPNGLDAAATRGVAALIADAAGGARRVQDIVKDLRVFARADDDQQRPFDVRAVLESSIQIVWNEIRHRARLVRALAPVPPVVGNESRLGQVIVNLLVNAAQAIPDGRVEANEIRVSSRVDGARVILEVTDTGTGIAPAVRARIFDPFFTTKPVGAGLGLGLSVCRALVTAMHGEIEVDSEVGKGTTFRLILPAAPAPARDAAASAAAAGPEAGRRGQILVVDDEPVLLSVIERLLADEHAVTTCTSAVDALARLRAGARYDVILCDLMMPEMSGMDLHAALAAELPEQAARMVFVTGGAFTPRARAFLDEVPCPRIAKPFEMASLRAVLRDVIDGPAAAASRS